MYISRIEKIDAQITLLSIKKKGYLNKVETIKKNEKFYTKRRYKT